MKRRVILFINSKKKNARDFSVEVLEELSSLKIDTDSFLIGKDQEVASGKAYDVAISLGGDGTVLSTARIMSPLGVPVFPVNLGTFGFIAGIQPSEWKDVFREWLEDKVPISRRLMLEVKVLRKGEEIFQGCCLNDVVISAPAIAKIINLKVSFTETDRNNVLKLGSYHSDGIVISTPTGSTAYSAAAGGPIIDPELETVVLNPICPFTLTHRPMVLPAVDTVSIEIEIEEEQRNSLMLTVDGQVHKKLKKGDIVYLKKAPYNCLLVASGRAGFYQALRTKLAWIGEDKSQPAQVAGSGNDD